jgi:hypothetical protein
MTQLQEAQPQAQEGVQALALVSPREAVEEAVEEALQAQAVAQEELVIKALAVAQEALVEA